MLGRYPLIFEGKIMTNAEMDKYIETEEFVDTLLDKIEDSGFTVDEILEELTKTIN